MGGEGRGAGDLCCGWRDGGEGCTRWGIRVGTTRGWSPALVRCDLGSDLGNHSQGANAGELFNVHLTDWCH
jgi:hypothetical protein